MARDQLAPLLLLGVFSACSTIVGADFDDKAVGEPSTQGASGASSSGSGGAARGGESSGGATTQGGTSSGGVSSGGTGQGGSSQSGGAGGSTGGVASGGVAAGGSVAGGAVGSGGTLVVSGGRASDGGLGGSLAGAGGDAGSGGSAGGLGGAGGVGGTDGGAGAEAGAGGAPGEGVVVINEVRGQGTGDDYIELVNAGPGLAHLGGLSIADSDLSHRFVFPNTTALAKGAYLLILLNQSSTRETTCYTPNPCFHVTWGVSNNGEAVFLRSAANVVLDTTVYPDQNGTGGLEDTQSWGRLPDTSGTFQATTPTAEMPNQP
jgi:hypothetical protein